MLKAALSCVPGKGGWGDCPPCQSINLCSMYLDDYLAFVAAASLHAVSTLGSTPPLSLPPLQPSKADVTQLTGRSLKDLTLDALQTAEGRTLCADVLRAEAQRLAGCPMSLVRCGIPDQDATVKDGTAATLQFPPIWGFSGSPSWLPKYCCSSALASVGGASPL